MYCSKASNRNPSPAARNVSCATLNPGSMIRVSRHASESNTAIKSCISPRAITGSLIRKRGTSRTRASATILGAVHPITAYDDRINVESLGQFESTRPRWLKLLRQAEVVERIHTVSTAHRRKSGRSKTCVEDLGRSLANPLKIWLSGSVLEWKDQQNPVLACICLRPSRSPAARAWTPNAGITSNAIAAHACTRLRPSAKSRKEEHDRLDYRCFSSLFAAFRRCQRVDVPRTVTALWPRIAGRIGSARSTGRDLHAAN